MRVNFRSVRVLKCARSGCYHRFPQPPPAAPSRVRQPATLPNRAARRRLHPTVRDTVTGWKSYPRRRRPRNPEPRLPLPSGFPLSSHLGRTVESSITGDRESRRRRRCARITCLARYYSRAHVRRTLRPACHARDRSQDSAIHRHVRRPTAHLSVVTLHSRCA